MRSIPLLTLCLCACIIDTTTKDTKTTTVGSDADTDADTDSDTDADTDADSDADTDTDTDADGDMSGHWAGACTVAGTPTCYQIFEPEIDLTMDLGQTGTAVSGSGTYDPKSIFEGTTTPSYTIPSTCFRLASPPSGSGLPIPSTGSAGTSGGSGSTGSYDPTAMTVTGTFDGTAVDIDLATRFTGSAVYPTHLDGTISGDTWSSVLSDPLGQVASYECTFTRS